MPRYRVTLDDGRVVTLEADQPPSVEDVRAALGSEAEPPLSEKARATALWAGTKEGIGATLPVAAGLVGAAALPAGAVAAGLRTVTSPAVAGTIGAIGGGVRGYRRGGLFGGLEGAVRGGFEGAVGGRAVHGLGLGGLLRTVGAAGPAAAAAEPLVSVGGQRIALQQLGPAARRLVLDPQAAARVAQLERLASGAGTGLGSNALTAQTARAELLRLLGE